MSCVIVGASECDIKELQEAVARVSPSFVVAVDGGYAYLQKAGIKPDVCIGDFDSLGEIPDHEYVLRYPSEKDQSDMELALNLARQHGEDDLLVFGALGLRFDHTLANLGIFSEAATRGVRISARGVHEDIFFVTSDKPLCFSAEERGVLSLFSLKGTASGVDLMGLKYELRNALISQGSSLGLSNEFMGVESCVSLKSGLLVAVRPK